MRRIFTSMALLLFVTLSFGNYKSGATYFPINRYPFLEFIRTMPYQPIGVLLVPDVVRWPAGSVQVRPNISCTAGDDLEVSVEVLKTGTTDTDPMAPGAGISCVVHIGRVTAFGMTACDISPIFQCVRNYPMTYAGADNGAYDVFTVEIPDLPPGTYEYTCACADAGGPLVNPQTHMPADAVRWIGDNGQCPSINPFINGRVTVTGAAPNDVCTDTPENIFTGENDVDNLCSVDGKSWFRYTVPNTGTWKKVDIDVLKGDGNLDDPVLFDIRLDACGGTAVPVNSLPVCVDPGTVLFIEAGKNCPTPGGMGQNQYGTFEIEVTLVNDGVPNDTCGMAIALNNFGGNNQLTCGEDGTFSGDPDACPDTPDATCFGATENGVWYSFTVNEKLRTFSITVANGGVYQLFSGTCASLTSHGCSVTNFAVVAGTTYYLLVGDQGTVTVDADQNIPGNDLCSGATVLTVPNATLNNQTNVCANMDEITDCDGEQEQNVVWYSFTMPEGMENASIDITPSASGGIDGPAIAVYRGTCAGLIHVDSECADTSLDLECLSPGITYYIQIGSSTANSGGFTIGLVTSDNGVPNDRCADATLLNIPNDCLYHDITTNTTDACPETFSLACNGGNYNADGTVWLKFTVPAGVTSLNIRNVVPAEAYLSIIDNCTNPQLIAGGGCIFGNGPSGDILVTAGTTYYIAVARAGNAGTVDFEIRYNERPTNDACTSPETVLTGTQSNLCATQDVVNNDCTTQDNASVWYSYTFPASSTDDEIEISITPTGTPAITDGLVAVYSSCNAASLLMDEDGNDCNASALIKCPVPGTSYLIMIGSDHDDAGQFTITVETNDNGVENETCAEATNIVLDNALCETPPNTLAGDNNDACPEPATLNFGGCTFQDGPGVWYKFTTGPNTELVDIEVTGINTDIGLFSSCTGTSVAGGCGTGGEITDVEVSPNTVYYLLVSGDNGAEGNFTINITEKKDPPTNDECANADPVTIGTTTNLDNLCATDDFTPCTTSQNEASVWYSFTYAGPGNEIIFTATGTGTNPLTNPSVIVYSDCNPADEEDDADATDCNNTFTLECPVPGTTYYIFVSSTSNNAGGFSLNVQVNNDGPANDQCSMALDIDDEPVCEFFTVETSTTEDACPETFTVAGCALDYSSDAIVWYEFTTPDGTTSIEIEDIAAGAYLTIFQSPCPTTSAPTIVTGGSCLTGAGTNGTPINVNDNTTYLIGIGIPDDTGDVSFDIKYNLEPENDNPCEGSFTAEVLSNNITLTNQDNTCASDDDEMCDDDQITNTLWYSFTITAPNNSIEISVVGAATNGLNDPSIALYDNIGAGTPNVPCTETPINEDCDGDGMVTFNCLNPGTYLIQIGSTNTNSGVFSVTVSQSNNTAVANDNCTDAELIDITALCTPLDFMTTNIDACPENLPAGSFSLPCDFNSEETSWYEFTAPGVAGDMPTMDFTFTSYTGSGTPFMGIFQYGTNCTTLTPVSTTCRDGLNETFGNIGPFTPGQQYLIAISSYGDTGGDFEFTVKFNIGPANDDPCATVIPVDFDISDENGHPGSTLCAGGDPFFPDCPQVDQQNVVFFKIEVPDDVRGVNISVRSNNASSTPIPAGSQVVVGLFEETACNSTTYVEASCITLGNSYDFLCLEPGTHYLQVSTSSANEGDFIVQAEFIEYTTSCPLTLNHDVCEDALEISSGGVYCTPITIEGCNNQACPEPFTYTAACPFETMPVVWYKFTVDAGVSSVDITSLQSTPASLFLTIFEDNDCEVPPTAISDCITQPTNNIAVEEGQTYFIAVGINSADMLGGEFRFGIRFNKFPENDDPDVDSDRPPFDLSGGGSHDGTTCCAIGFADDSNLDYPNLGCSPATHDDAVWYIYTVTDEKGLEVTVGPSGGSPISGNTTIEVYEGTETAPGGLITPNSYDCSPLPSRIKFGCLEPGTIVWVKVASRETNCGTFSITIEEPDICEYAETCADITDAQTMTTAPTDLECGAFVLESIAGCLDLACPEESPTDCGIGENPTVWFQINTDMDAVQLYTFVNTNGNWDPVWAIYYGECDNLTLANGGTIAMPTPCSNGDSTPEVHNIGIPEGPNGDPIQTFYVAVSGQGVIDDPSFTLSAFTQAGCVSCIGDDCGQPLAEFEITERSSNRPLDDLLFCQNEEVRVCLEFYYDPSETGVDWFHGLLPDFGPGWDMDYFDPSNVTVTPAGAAWLGPDDGECAPIITETMPYLCSYTDSEGNLRLCHILCQTCPCAAPLGEGSALPNGWFWNSNGGAGCQNTCNPSTRYGVPGSQGGLTVNICMNLKTRVFDDFVECNEKKSLQIKFVTTSDGVSGCWNDPIAECKLDIAQVGPQWELDCTPPVLVDFEDVEICDLGQLNSPFETSDGSTTPINIEPIPNANVNGMNPYTFPTGYGVVTDILDNLTSEVQVAEYIVWAQDPAQLCPGPRDTFRVTIYPNLQVQFEPQYVCDGFCIDLTPSITGGTGNYVEYQWSNGQNTPSINVCPAQTTTYYVTVTDDLGCTGSGEVEVEVKLPVTFELAPDRVDICKDGIEDQIVVEPINIIANGFYGVNWDIPSGIDGFQQVYNYIIFDETSTEREEPYILCATVVDQFGCEGDACMEVKINLTPFVELLFRTPYRCGDETVNFTVEYIPLDNLNPFAWFYLYDCDDNLIAQTYGSFADFNDVVLAPNTDIYCYKVVVVDDVSGCQNFDVLEFPAATGTPVIVSPNVTICEGSFTTIAVQNPAAFNSFLWTPGGVGTPSRTVNPSVTTEYRVRVTDLAGCKDSANVLVTVAPLPVPNVTGSLTFCPGGSTTLLATGGTSYVWRDATNAIVSNNAQLGPISTPGTYTVSVTNANGCSATATRTIVQANELDIDVADLPLCDNTPDTLDAGPGFSTYLWIKAPQDTLGSTRKVEVSSTGTFYIVVTSGACSGRDTVLVTNSNTPQLTLDTLTVCRINSGQGPTSVNFVALQNGVAGQWFNTDLAPVNTTDWSNVSFTTVGSRDTFTFTFISTGAIAPCENITETVEIVVRNCACPLPTVSAPNPLCNSAGGTNSVNLNNLRLGHTNPGTWTVVSGPAPPPVINGGILNASNAAAGTHRLRFTLNPLPGGNCPDSSEVDLIIYNAPFAAADSVTLCNQNTGGEPTGVDLNTLLKTGTTPGGTWAQTSGPAAGGTIPNISVLNLPVNARLVFTYTTVGAQAPCTDVSTQVVVKTRDCSCPLVTLLPDTVCNGSNTLLNLQNPLKFSTDPAGLAGNWTITPAPATITNGNFFNPLGVPSGEYTATFTLTGTFPPLCPKAFTKKIVVRNQNEALAPGNACSSQTGQGATSVNLFSLLKSGFTSGGSWTQVSPAAPMLTIPGNGLVEFNGQAIGSQFVFRYNVPSAAPCLPVDVTVNVRDCNCPPIEIGTPGKLCNQGGVQFGILNLATLEINVAPGIWTVRNQLGDAVTINGKIFDVNGLPPGNYTVTYTLVPAPGGTCTQSVSRVVIVENYNTATLKKGTVCNTTSSGNSTILNLNSLIEGIPPINGVWLDPAGNPVSNFLAVNFNGFALGVYTYTYKIDNNDPCTDLSLPLEIEVIDCNCPKFILKDPAALCNNTGTLDLATLEDEVPAGSWEVKNTAGAVIALNGKILNLTGLPAGQYTLTYIVTNPEGSCPKSKEVKLTVFAPKNAGTGTTASFCTGVTDVVNLVSQLTGQDPGGIWTSTQTTGFNATAGTFNLTGIAPGTYTFNYSFINQAPCPDASSTVTIRVNELPVANAGPDKNLDCIVKSTEIGGNSSTGADFTYAWTFNGTPAGNTRTITVSLGGDYTLEVTNTVTGCKNSDIVRVIQSNDLPMFDVVQTDVLCFGQKNGTISVVNLTGGKAPYQYSFDGGVTFVSSDKISNVAPGTYKVVVRESNGCTNDKTVTVKEPLPLSISLGPDARINLGDSVLLSIEGKFDVNRITSIVWKANGLVIFSGQNILSFFARPEDDTRYEVILTDANGCSTSDEILITITRVRILEIPNIIYLDADKNKLFTVESKDVDRILNFRIYDRWGNLVYNVKSLDPVTDRDKFWNGTFKGQQVEQGVYVYIIDVLFKDGAFETRAGDVTVLR